MPSERTHATERREQSDATGYDSEAEGTFSDLASVAQKRGQEVAFRGLDDSLQLKNLACTAMMGPNSEE